MRIACIDRSAAQRVGLQKLFEQAYSKCRNISGHLRLADTYPASPTEITVSTRPDAAAIGPSFSVEEVCALARQILSVHPGLPLFVLLAAENYSLRNLRRLERVTSDIFCVDEDPTRLVYRITSLISSAERPHAGTLVSILGVKGGVGATSIASALAHASAAFGKSSVIADLSRQSSLSCYFSAPRWHSPELAAALSERALLSKELVQKCLVTAPNGITLLLAPAGGSEVRDLWLRDAGALDFSLSFFEVLLEMFDVVFVDHAAAEGVLPFALSCRADMRLLVSANDPASVHLLSATLASLKEAPGGGGISIVLNRLFERGLSREDVIDLLFEYEHFEAQMLELDPLPFDRAAGAWIGTGNSFYTEASRSMQLALDDLAASILRLKSEGRQRAGHGQRLLGFFQSMAASEKAPKRLPLLAQERTAGAAPADAGQQEHKLTIDASGLLRPPFRELNESFYEPPTAAAVEGNGSQRR